MSRFGVSAYPSPPPIDQKAATRSEFASDGAAASPSATTEGVSKVRLPMTEVGLVNKKAQIRGTVMGITGGLMFGMCSVEKLKWAG